MKGQHLKNLTLCFSEVLRKEILSGVFSSNGKLPTFKVMARAFNVSHSTISTALRVLEEESLIERHRGSGVFLAGRYRNPTVKSDSVLTKAGQIADTIKEEIAHGHYRAGTRLPHLKNLVFRYKTCYRTMQKSIRLLIEKGVVHRRLKVCWIGKSPPPRSRISDKCVYRIGEPIPSSRQMQRVSFRDFFLMFELELHKYDIHRLEFAGYAGDIRELLRTRKNKIAGFYLHTTFIRPAAPMEERRRELEQLYRLLEQCGHPFVVDDYDAVCRQFPGTGVRPGKNVFPIWRDSYKDGVLCGAFLSSLGHRSVAFFTFGDNPVTRSRYQGLVDELHNASDGKSEVSDFTNREMQPSEIADIFGNYETVFRTQARNTFAGYSFSAVDPLKEGHLWIQDLILKDQCTVRMRPLFEKALKNKGITAWVCTGTPLSSVAAEFLENREIDVPGQLSLVVMGGDDVVIDKGVSTYDNQRGLAGYLAAHCILGDIPVVKNREGLVEHEGRIIMRGTTGSV